MRWRGPGRGRSWPLAAGSLLALAASVAAGPPARAAQAAPSGAGPSETSAPAATVVRALQATLGTTGRVSISLAGTAVGASGANRVQATGSFDFTAAQGSVTLEPAAGLREPIIFTPKAVYIRPPPSTASLLPPGKPWMIADFSNAEALTTNFPQFVLQIESIDPAFTLDELAWGAVSARAEGRSASGQPGTRYRVRIDLHQALAGARGPARAPFSFGLHSELSNLAGGGSGGPASLGADVLVDQRGRVSRVTLSPPGAGVGTTTLSVTSFGVPVTAQPPPGRRTIDVAEITPLGERENNHGGDSDGA